MNGKRAEEAGGAAGWDGDTAVGGGSDPSGGDLHVAGEEPDGREICGSDRSWAWKDGEETKRVWPCQRLI